MDIVYRQIGALPYRIAPSGEIEIALVTSRGTGQWIVPKGWPMDGLSDPEAAAREAYEEAGLIGTMNPVAFGTFSYEKEARGSDDTAPFVADIYIMKVDRQLAFWPEAHQRRTAWVSIRHGMELVSNPSLVDLLARFEASLPAGD